MVILDALKLQCLQLESTYCQHTVTDVGNNASTSNSTNDGNTPDNEERDDPLNNFRSPSNETCIQSLIPDYPVTVQEKRQFGYTVEREIKLSPVKYFNARLLHLVEDLQQIQSISSLHSSS